MLAVQMLRRGDDNGINSLIVQKPAMIGMNRGARHQVVRVIQTLVVNVGECCDLNIRASGRLMNQFRPALPCADNSHTHAVVRAQHPS
jgi:hypothetical protein